MKYSVDQLFEIAYHHYPRGMLLGSPAYGKTKEYHNFLNTCRQSSEKYEHFHNLMARLTEYFPQHRVMDHAVSLVTPSLVVPKCAGMIELPNDPSELAHLIEFRLSLLAPYYKIYSRRIVNSDKPIQRLRQIYVDDTCYTFPMDMSIAQIEECLGLSNLQAIIQEEPIHKPSANTPSFEHIVSFELSPEEQPFGDRVAREIELNFEGYEAMPPDIGHLVVPGIGSGDGIFGHVTLYDCLMWDR